jgi:hypothetical protein
LRPFAPRLIAFKGLLTHDQWRLKHYTVAHSGGPTEREAADWTAFHEGRGLALATLPVPARTVERPGVGLLIEHRGLGADYVVLGWWDRENELPVRVMVREADPGASWRPAGESESFCVWDLQVIAFERDAYVATIMSSTPMPDALERYLATAFRDEPRATADYAAPEPIR